MMMVSAAIDQDADTVAGEPITAAQRRALFAAGRAHGLDIDTLRALTPAGSISMLTRDEAARLLDRLNGGTNHEHPRRSPRDPRRPKDVYRMATDAQHRKIEALRIDLGWGGEKLHQWLSDRHHDDGRPLTTIDSSRDAQAVIELLKVVLARTRKARNGGRSSDERRLIEGRSIGSRTEG